MNKENSINERQDEASSPSDKINTGGLHGLPQSTGSDQMLDNGYKIEVSDGDGNVLSWVKVAKPEQENYMMRAIQILVYSVAQKAKEGRFPEGSCWVSVRGEGKWR